METTHTEEMNSAIAFTKKNIVPLAKLIVEMQNTGLLSNGTLGMVHELASMLPACGRQLPLAETLIRNECLEIVANTNKNEDISVIDILTECQTLFNTFNDSWRTMSNEERLAYITKTFSICDRISDYKANV